MNEKNNNNFLLLLRSGKQRMVSECIGQPNQHIEVMNI